MTAEIPAVRHTQGRMGRFASASVLPVSLQRLICSSARIGQAQLESRSDFGSDLRSTPIHPSPIRVEGPMCRPAHRLGQKDESLFGFALANMLIERSYATPGIGVPMKTFLLIGLDPYEILGRAGSS